MSSPAQPEKKRSTSILNLVVNSLVAIAWLGGAVMFFLDPNPFKREGPAQATWLVIALLVIISLMLISDLWNTYKTRARSIEAVSGLFMWVGFLGGLVYYLTDFPGSNWLAAIAALMVGLSFLVRVIMTLRKVPQTRI